MNGSHKIASQHLARPAMVYVRQSTLDQVRHHWSYPGSLDGVGLAVKVLCW